MKTLCNSIILIIILILCSCSDVIQPTGKQESVSSKKYAPTTNQEPVKLSNRTASSPAQPPPPPPPPTISEVHENYIPDERLEFDEEIEFDVYDSIEINGDTDFGNLNRTGYDQIVENEFLAVTNEPLSTFSIDVDRASYSNCRRYLQSGMLPPPSAVRLEEFVNYFEYNYEQPKGEDPFSITTEIADCPWSASNKLLHIGLQGRKLSMENLPASNLVFLLDVSGSMNNYDKLPLLKQAFKLLLDQLRPQDKVAIVVYAGSSGLVLPSTSGANKATIFEALDRLSAGGSTAGGQGIKLAYNVAKENFLQEGNNRVILATDGDFNVGVSSDGELVKLIEQERERGVFLSVLGFGTGNYQDAKMEKLADNGNGNYNYIDNIKEAKKVLVNEIGATLFTIAKDVKLQLEFNPNQVESYRLLGYENRMLKNEDFNNDKKDAGDIGAGHSVTAVYEIVPKKENEFTPSTNGVDPLKYSGERRLSNAAFSKEWATIKFRYKKPDENKSRLITKVATLSSSKKVSDNYKLSAGIINFGMLLRKSKFATNMNYDRALDLVKSVNLPDSQDSQQELIQLIKTAKSLNLPN